MLRERSYRSAINFLVVPPRDLPSRALYQGRDRAGARSFLYAIGLTAEDIEKPFIGVSNCWTETMPCNFGLRELAVPLKAGIRAAGANPMEFNTIAISDGITMGSEGMKTSLVSREVIADSIELVGRGHQFDAMCALCACDKTTPASAMALVRLDRPGMVLYGGSIMAGRFRGRDVNVGEVYEAIGSVAAGKMSVSRRRCVRRPVHGEHHVDADGSHRALAIRLQLHPGNGSGQGSCGGSRRAPDAIGARPGPSALAHPHAARLRQRHRCRGRERRVNQCRPSPACVGA
jgi:hypothetical protein